MSDYDFRAAQQRGSDALDYTNSGSGGGLWAAIGVVAVLGIVIALFVGLGGTTEDGTASPDAGMPAVPAPAAAPPAAGE